MTKRSDEAASATGGATAADVHGFYAALFVLLPPGGLKTVNVSIECFAGTFGVDRCAEDPWAAFVEKATGSWRCRECGATGDALDAALLRGFSRAEAMELLTQYGLAHGGDHCGR